MRPRQQDLPGTIDKIHRVPVSEEAVDRILQLISSGKYGPGDQLPPERQLAETLGIGRTSVREALRTLVAYGILRVEQGRGTFVQDINLSHTLRLILQTMPIDRRVALEVMFIREAIEKETVKIAALKRTDEHLRQLHYYVEEMSTSLDRMDRFAAMDSQFHLTLLEAAGNKTARVVYQLLYEALAGSRAWREGLRANDELEPDPGGLETAVIAGNIMLTRLEQALDESMPRAVFCHRQILQAVEIQDPELASSWMVIHLRDVQQAIRRTGEAS